MSQTVDKSDSCLSYTLNKKKSCFKSGLSLSAVMMNNEREILMIFAEILHHDKTYESKQVYRSTFSYLTKLDLDSGAFIQSNKIGLVSKINY